MATATAKKPTKKAAAEKKLKKSLAELNLAVKANADSCKPKPPNPQAKARSDKLLAALKELGTGKNKIAESLKVKKIRGKMGDSDECPMAVFVKKLFPKATGIQVDAASIDVSFEKEDFNFSVVTPKLIGQFIDDFDSEKYPDLVKA